MTWSACSPFVRAAVLVGLGFLCGCASPQGPTVKDWRQDNRKLGTITILKGPAGPTWEYRDLQNRLVRVDYRDQSGQLRTGPCTRLLDYAPTGEKSAERCLDPAGKPCLGLDGVATRRWSYSRDAQSNQVVEESCFDCSGHQVPTPLGCNFIRRTLGDQARLRRVQFLDAPDKPHPVTWLQVPAVAEAQYVVLSGVGDVECVALFDAHGNVIARKQLNGQTSLATRTETTTCDYSTVPSQHRH